VLLHPYMPSSTERLLTALGALDTGYERASFCSRAGGQSVGPLEPLFPKRT